MEKPFSNDSMDIKRQSTAVSTECKICGAPTTHSYFGVISCQACKVFFRRNAEQGQKIFKCDFDGHCEITPYNRQICSYCRLVKCFASGMQIEMFRPPRSTTSKKSQKRKTSTALVRLNEPAQLPTLSLLRSDQSSLTINQWDLLSNLSHCYDEYSGLSMAERYMHEQNILPLKLRFKIASVINLYHMSLDKNQLLYTNNRDFLSLSPDDRSTLLHGTFEYTGALLTTFILHRVRLMEYSAYYDALAIMAPPSIIPTIKRLGNRLDLDTIIVKLFLAILSFSTISYTIYSNTPPVILSNIKQILHIQDTYAELIWRYLLYKYNYQQAVKCFSDLIKCIFGAQEAIDKVHNDQWYTDIVDSTVQQTEQCLTLSD